MPKGRYYGKDKGLQERIATKDAPVGHNREFVFLRSSEARAFTQGIELVNDSSIKAVATVRRRHGKNGNRYVVLVQDDDEATELAAADAVRGEL